LLISVWDVEISEHEHSVVATGVGAGVSISNCVGAGVPIATGDGGSIAGPSVGCGACVGEGTGASVGAYVGIGVGNVQFGCGYPASHSHTPLSTHTPPPAASLQSLINEQSAGTSQLVPVNLGLHEQRPVFASQLPPPVELRHASGHTRVSQSLPLHPALQIHAVLFSLQVPWNEQY